MMSETKSPLYVVEIVFESKSAAMSYVLEVAEGLALLRAGDDYSLSIPYDARENVRKRGVSHMGSAGFDLKRAISIDLKERPAPEPKTEEEPR